MTETVTLPTWVFVLLLAFALWAAVDRLLVPAGQRIERWFGWFHQFQQGLTQYYVLYILIAVILMLSTLIPFDDFFVRLLAR